MGETTYEWIHNPRLLKDTITHAQEEYNKARITHQAKELARAIASTNTGLQPSQLTIADELHKLFELLQRGAITQEEYILMKNRLLRSWSLCVPLLEYLRDIF